MIEHLGAKRLGPLNPLLKRDLLLFDAVVTSDLPRTLATSAAADVAAVESLAAEGLIRDIAFPSLVPAFHAGAGDDALFREKAALGILLLEIGVALARYRSLVGDEEDNHEWVAVLGHQNHVDYTARMIALHYRDHPTVRAVPLLSDFSAMDSFRIERNAGELLGLMILIRREYVDAVRTLRLETQTYREFYEVAVDILQRLVAQEGAEQSATRLQTNVLQVVLEDFPMPDESVAWEQILDYRRDPESRRRLKWLRAWMKQVSEAEHTEREIREEYEELLFSFRDHMRFHRMKSRPGAFQALLTLLENTVKLQFTKLPEVLFWTRHRQIELLEAERAAPGRELAYVVASEQQFGK